MAKASTKSAAIGNAIGLHGSRGEAIPLQGVHITGRLEGSAAALTIRQRYHNDGSAPVEAIYLFPLPSESAVTGLEVRVGDRTLQAAIEEREKAFERYDEALRDGHGAVLLDQERPNVFQMSVGSILPGQTVVAEVRLAFLADSWERGVRLTIPSTISPRYVPSSLPPDVLREIERTTPPYALDVPYGLSVQIDVGMASAIRALESPSHPVRAEIDGRRARVTFSRGEEAADRDFVFTVETAEPHSATAFVASHGSRDHLLVELRPDLPRPETGSRDMLFLVDCSGSMDGDSIDQARRAVELCLRAMNLGDRFQVVRFGSSHEPLFTEYQAYSQETLDHAVGKVRTMRADLGGTEILAALESAAKTAHGQRLDAIVLTDGEVANEADVLAFASRHRSDIRFFTFGIGASSSEFLVRGLARESGGEAEFIYPGERIEDKVLRQFGRIATPAIDGLTLDWGAAKIEQAPAALPPVFSGGLFRAFARIATGSTVLEGAVVRLRGTTAGGPVEWSATVARAAGASAIPQLWARERIRDLEAGFGVAAGSRQQRGTATGRRGMVAISREYAVLCSETSFIAVEQRADSERTDGEVELRRVPAMVTAGWHGIGRARFMHPSMPAAARISRPMSMPDYSRVSSLSTSSSMPACEESNSVDFNIPTFLRRGRLYDALPAPTPWHITLLTQQRADGSFTLTKELLKAAKLSSGKAKALRKDAGLEEDVFATALAVVTLRLRAPGLEDSWRAAVGKAGSWLAGTGACVDDGSPVAWLEARLAAHSAAAPAG